MTDPYERLRALGLQLPTPPAPIGSFRTAVIEHGLMFLSGQGPTFEDGSFHQGKVGADVSADEAYDHARLTGLNLLAVMDDVLGDLRRVRRVVKIFGMVNAVAEFGDHAAVINGCSALFHEVFGEAGEHSRTSMGVGSLPRRITVEIEAVIAIA